MITTIQVLKCDRCGKEERNEIAQRAQCAPYFRPSGWAISWYDGIVVCPTCMEPYIKAYHEDQARRKEFFAPHQDFWSNLQAQWKEQSKSPENPVDAIKRERKESQP